MQIKYLLAASFASIAVASVALPQAAQAQQITTSIQGTVVDEFGNPIPNANVVVTDTRTQAQRTITTGGNGSFNATNLTSGGPYTISASASGYEGQQVDGVYTTVQAATDLTFTLVSGTGTIIVQGARVQLAEIAVGPGTSFGQEVLDSAPSFNRDIRDVIRFDPRVSLDRDDGGSGVDRVSCLGGNDRMNAFTVDGINQGDTFGLNDSPFASRSSSPLPYDAVRETQVAFAPFDVDYGNFTGCAINVITESGSNEIRFGGFFEYSDNGMRGDTVAGVAVAPVEPEKRWGAWASGPIIPDRLFIFGAYEHQEAAFSQDFGPAGAGFAIELPQVTAAQFNEISDVLSSVYGVETGDLVTSRPFSNDRYFVRADLIITDGHRFEATYQRLEEASTFADDFSSTGSFAGAIVGENTFYLSGTESDYYSGRLYSQWTDDFSTEFRVSRAEIQDLQDPIGGGEAQSGNPIPRFVIGVQNPGQAAGAVQAGPGFSRAANDLRSTVMQYRAAAEWELGDHRIKFGGELNRADVYNLFAQNATGQLVFRNIDDLRNGILSNGTSTFTNPSTVVSGGAVGAYGNFSATGDINAAAAQFEREIWSLFVQDEYSATDRLDLILGLRIDMFNGDAPPENPNFVARYGITNAVAFDALDDVWLPRAAFTYDLDDFAVFSRPELRGGVGVFSGGDPLVWFSNAFSNNGFGVAEGDTTDAPCPAGPIDVVVNGQFTGFPTCVITAASAGAAGATGDTQSIDPNIEQPTVLRANLGYSATMDFAQGGFFSGWGLNLDYIYSRYRNPLTVVDLAQVVDPSRGLGGFTVDGRPIYRAIDPTRNGCAAEYLVSSPTPRYSNVTAACFGTGRDDELQLTNSDGYESHVASIILSKRFDGGLFTEAGNVDFSFGYAYTDAEDRRNLYNSTATSNYDRSAFFDQQDPAASRGFYSSEHNISTRLSFREEFFEDLSTRLGITFVARSGRPYSLTFGGSGVLNDSSAGADNQLIYVPTGAGDPNIRGGNAGDVQALADFLSSLDCAQGFEGRSIDRNTCSGDWYYDLDLSISQEIPGPGRLFGRDDKLRLYATFDNFLNFLDDDWNVQRRRNFVGLQDIVNLSSINANGQYVISPIFTQNGETALQALQRNFDSDNQINFSSSVWRLKVGVSYEF